MTEANHAEAVARQDVISELLCKSFAARTVCEQKDILQHKKPLPWLRVRNGNCIFQEEWYTKNEWLPVICKDCFVGCVCCSVIGKVDKKRCTDMHGFLSDCRTHERIRFKNCVL